MSIFVRLLLYLPGSLSTIVDCYLTFEFSPSDVYLVPSRGSLPFVFTVRKVPDLRDILSSYGPGTGSSTSPSSTTVSPGTYRYFLNPRSCSVDLLEVRTTTFSTLGLVLSTSSRYVRLPSPPLVLFCRSPRGPYLRGTKLLEEVHVSLILLILSSPEPVSM